MGWGGHRSFFEDLNEVELVSIYFMFSRIYLCGLWSLSWRITLPVSHPGTVDLELFLLPDVPASASIVTQRDRAKAAITI